MPKQTATEQITPVHTKAAIKKEFIRTLDQMAYGLRTWEKWEAIISVMACTLSNIADTSSERIAAREKEYRDSMGKLRNDHESASRLFALTMEYLERYPETDFLGDMYMELNLGDHWKGQFFTPYHVAKMMSMISFCGSREEIMGSKECITINDPTCGAGVMLIAAAGTLREKGINYQKECMFSGQDIDRLAAQMCFIQLSLIGARGYVRVGNSLTDPILGEHEDTHTGNEALKLWYTPMYWEHSQKAMRKAS